MAVGAIALLTMPIRLTATVVAQRFVTTLGAYPTAGGATKGVTRTAGVAGDLVPVDSQGTAVVEAGAAVTVGATIQSDATGRAIPYAAGSKVGVALTAGAAAGALIEVELIPNG